MKLLVETCGAIQLIDYAPINPLIRHEGYTVVTSTDFVQHRVALGDINIIGKLSDEATDPEWLKWVEGSDHDHELAAASFLSKFGAEAPKPAPAPAPAPAPKPLPVSPKPSAT